MSWEGIKKNLNRAGTSLLQKTGVIDKTIDTDYLAQESRLTALGGRVEKLHQAAKTYLDSVRAVSLLQERLATGLESLASPQDTAAYAQVTGFKRAAEELSATTKKQWDESYRVAVLDPVARFGILFPECQELAKRRAAKLLDYDAARSKSLKAVEKPSGDPSRLPRLEAEAEDARRAYEEINETLLDGIPQLLKVAPLLLEPSLQALLELQTILAEKHHQIIAGLASEPYAKTFASEDALEELCNLKVLHL